VLYFIVDFINLRNIARNIVFGEVYNVTDPESDPEYIIEQAERM